MSMDTRDGPNPAVGWSCILTQCFSSRPGSRLRGRFDELVTLSMFSVPTTAACFLDASLGIGAFESKILEHSTQFGVYLS